MGCRINKNSYRDFYSTKILEGITSRKTGLKILSTILTDHLHLQPNF